MKLFQQLLVAPAALGLLAPLAAQASQPDVNLTGVNRYAGSSNGADEQVTSISQFADVKPTDWAYQALTNLIERYGCVAGYPNGTFAGGKAITRFEAAALVNACLDRVTETTDELKKLLAEFQKELAILKGRVDGLDARVGVLEARQFSTTTKLSGIASLVIGGVSNGSVANPDARVTDQVTFNYNVNLNLDTSFNGKDLLRTTLRSNNFQNSVFGEDGTAALEDAAEPQNVGADAIGISRLFYQFPIGEAFTATVGAKVRQDDMLAMWPSAYEGDSILDRMHAAGASGAYSMNIGSGVGLSYQKNGFSISALYISNQLTTGNSGTVSNTAAETSVSGFGRGATTTAQVGYAAKNWGMAFAYNYTQATESTALIDPNAGYEVAGANNLGFSAYWEPEKTGLIPSISAGVGTSYFNGGGNTSTWMVGLVWSDAFRKGNALGMAYGDTQTPGTDPGTYAYELYYKVQMSDNISVTPAFFWIDGSGTNPSSTGGLVKTTFRF